MQLRRMSTRFRLIAAILVFVMALAVTFTVQVVRTHAAPAVASVAPNSTNELDCNGWSTVYKSVRPMQRGLCTDPISISNGKAGRFVDNGWYVGHDEPSVKFISSTPGSGNHMTYFMQLAVDPHAAPTVAEGKKAVTDYGELSIAPWFGLPICDPNSYPLNPCTPDSDSNSGEISNPNDAGSAFLELQLYPPGFAPFADSFSCDPTHYCAALTIDSLESGFNFTNPGINPACAEPVNFAYLQRNGVPAGPPSPQLSDLSTETPNSQTLLMNQGDVLSVALQDTPNGVKATIHDFTTGQSGFMVASAANGFMNTNPVTCDGTPFNFHPEYSTAEQQNQVPWAAAEGGVLMEQEIGHFEVCSNVSNSFPVSITYGDGQTYSDPSVYQQCNSPVEAGGTGEGCNFTTGNCPGATTEGGLACPDPTLAGAANGELCEFSDAYCFPAGPRTVYNNGVPEVIKWPVAGCNADAIQNGDLDFDGTSYFPDWPDGSPNHPTPFRYYGPFQANGHPYPSIQFESDIAGSENDCNPGTGVGCTVPPLGDNNKPTFYPFWTIGSFCQWNFGNSIPGQTIKSFGGDAEYGTPDVARYGGTVISAVIANPQTSGGCSGFSSSHQFNN